MGFFSPPCSIKQLTQWVGSTEMKFVRGDVWVLLCFFPLTLELFRQVLFDIRTVFSNFTANPVRDPNLTDCYFTFPCGWRNAKDVLPCGSRFVLVLAKHRKASFPGTLKVHRALELSIFGTISITLSTSELMQNKCTTLVFNS